MGSTKETFVAKRSSLSIISDDQLATAIPAGLGRRLAAMLYDAFLIVALLILVDAIATWLYGDGVPANTRWLQAINLSVIILFYCYFWSRGGQTLGMRTWRIIALNDDGSVMPFQSALLRALFAILSFALLGAGYLILYWDPNRKTLHERISRTVTWHYERE